MHFFPDDTAIYLTFDNKGDSVILQRDLIRLQDWNSKWNMEFNPNKCQVIRVASSRFPLDTQYILHGQVLEVVSSARYLGVGIYSNLNWNTHVNRVAASANKSLGFIRCNIKTRSPKIREMAYKTFVHLQPEYA